MNFDDCYRLGFIHKAQGIAGELVVKTELEQSEQIISKWESIFLSIDGILVPFFIEQAFLKSSHNIVLKIEDIDDEIAVQNYRGLEVYVDKLFYKEEENNEGFVRWISYTVHDKTFGLIGELVEVQEFPAQVMLSVLSDTKQEFLIPANFDWILEADDEQKSLLMQLPDGLLSLND